MVPPLLEPPLMTKAPLQQRHGLRRVRRVRKVMLRAVETHADLPAVVLTWKGHGKAMAGEGVSEEIYGNRWILIGNLWKTIWVTGTIDQTDSKSMLCLTSVDFSLLP